MYIIKKNDDKSKIPLFHCSIALLLKICLLKEKNIRYKKICSGYEIDMKPYKEVFIVYP